MDGEYCVARPGHEGIGELPWRQTGARHGEAEQVVRLGDDEDPGPHTRALQGEAPDQREACRQDGTGRVLVLRVREGDVSLRGAWVGPPGAVRPSGLQGLRDEGRPLLAVDEALVRLQLEGG